MTDDWTALAIYENVDDDVQFSLFESKIKAWISLPSPEYKLYLRRCDVEHFNGRFYLITGDYSVQLDDEGLADYLFNPYFTLFSWRLHPDASRISLKCLCKKKEIFVDIGFYDLEIYLVDCAGSLLIVAMFDCNPPYSETDSDYDNSDSESDKISNSETDTNSDDTVENNDVGDDEDNDDGVVEHIRMSVFRVVRHQRLEFELLADLGGHALFVGRNHSFSVDTGKYPGLRRDSIYSIVHGENSIQIFSLPGETCWVRPIPKRYRWSPLAWLLGRSS